MKTYRLMVESKIVKIYR